MSSPEEIWATRLQRELLALTEEGEDTKHIGMLPPFIKVQNHNLDINEGICSVSFAITVDGVEKGGTNTPPVVHEEVKDKVDGALGEKEEEKDNHNEESTPTTEVQATDSTEPTSTISESSSKFKVQVIVTLDASLKNSASTSYPFFKPHAILTSGAEHFSPNQIQNGDEIQIDCDWTPSLHLNDAALNIALKVRESIKHGEPCLKVVRRQENVEDTLLREVKADLTKVGTQVSSFFSDLKNRASAVAEELDQAVGSSASATAGAGSNPATNKIFPRRKKEISKAAVKVKVVTVDNIDMGDQIDLAMDPWNKAVGMYPCKAIRRPDFVTAAMEASGQNNSDKVANAGLSGAGSMFRSWSKSAKGLVEESFVMLTEELIIEIRCNKFSVANATVSFAIPVSHLAKLKFRREESISLFFKQAPDDPIIYMCENSAEAVKQIQNILKRQGVRGKHTNATMQKTVQAATQMIDDIKVMENKLQESPSREQVTIIMDLYRQAAEYFEIAGDARHKEVMAHMRNFLDSPLVASILDGSFDQKQQATEVQKQAPVEAQEQVVGQQVPKGEVIEAAATDQDNVEADEDLEKAMEAAENILQDAHDDLKDLEIDDFDVDEDDNDLSAFVGEAGTSEVAGDDDMVSEFEDMLKDADKELQELMGS